MTLQLQRIAPIQKISGGLCYYEGIKGVYEDNGAE